MSNFIRHRPKPAVPTPSYLLSSHEARKGLTEVFVGVRVKRMSIKDFHLGTFPVTAEFELEQEQTDDGN